MASWFSGGGAALGQGLGETFNGLKDKVQSKVNNIDPDLIKKLTLQSDELVSERQRIDEEERRKETVRDSLAEILPWETRDAEMEILVDECKEVILGLSAKNETFTGPFVLAGGLPSGGTEEAEEEEGNDNNNNREEEDTDKKAAKDIAAAELSADKLSKLQPLPTLLADFDLDTHVGLIQRCLKEDPNLVDMHTRLSSGGQREIIFWKNYFFHCAYTRYEAGLSIDEIWSNEPRPTQPVAAVTKESEEYDVVNDPDEEVIFDSSDAESGSDRIADSTTSGPDASGVSDNAQPSVAAAATTTATTVPTSTKGGISPPSSPQRETTTNIDPLTPIDSAVEGGTGGNDYEFVSSTVGDDDDNGSMDELEAEIAAALDD